MTKRRQAPAHDPYDVTTCLTEAPQGAQEEPAASPGTWTPPEPAPRRRKRSVGRSYGPDTLPGLADYFISACPPISWAGTLDIGNRQAILGVFSEMRREAHLTPDDCRALVDLYVARLGSRRPSKAYCWDFKWQRYQLLAQLRDKGLTQTAEDHGTWAQTYQTDPGEAASFAQSWGSGS